ncbi:hypothetical protein GCM10027360_67750 [Amycolatopsis echigonensis]
MTRGERARACAAQDQRRLRAEIEQLRAELEQETACARRGPAPPAASGPPRSHRTSCWPGSRTEQEFLVRVGDTAVRHRDVRGA